MRDRYVKKTIFVMLMLLALVTISCALQTRSESPSAFLEETVRKYYQLKKDGKFYATWNFERRSIAPKSKEELEGDKRAYLQQEGKIPLKDFYIIEIGREGSHGETGFTPVKIKLITDWPPLGMAMPKGDRVLEMVDLWEKINGKWYHVKAAWSGRYY